MPSISGRTSNDTCQGDTVVPEGYEAGATTLGHGTQTLDQLGLAQPIGETRPGGLMTEKSATEFEKRFANTMNTIKASYQGRVGTAQAVPASTGRLISRKALDGVVEKLNQSCATELALTSVATLKQANTLEALEALNKMSGPQWALDPVFIANMGALEDAAETLYDVAEYCAGRPATNKCMIKCPTDIYNLLSNPIISEISEIWKQASPDTSPADEDLLAKVAEVIQRERTKSTASFVMRVSKGVQSLFETCQASIISCF